jgi:hypothetical protein
MLAVAAMVGFAQPAAADGVTGLSNEGYGRLLFALTPADTVQAQVTGSVLTISFGRKVSLTPETIAQSLPDYISNGRADADGRTFHFALTQTVRLHTSTATGRFAVDLAPQSYTRTPPNLPQPVVAVAQPVDPANLPAVRVRSGAYQNFTRVVFDWAKNVPYTVSAAPGKLTIRFGVPVKIDFSALDRQGPPWVKSGGWRLAGTSTIVELKIDAASGYHDFRDGTHVVIDVLVPRTDADAYNPPGMGRPTITAINGTAPSQPAPPPQSQQRQAPQQTARAATPAKPAPQPAAPAATPAPNQHPLPQGAQLPAVAPAVVAGDTPTQVADGRLTRDGAVLVFPGAGRQSVAVFTRGLNAWIILQVSQPLDVAKLKTQLGNFPTEVEATAGSGTIRLRIGLRQPSAIAAFGEGSNLKVVIASQVTPTAVAMGFARNQENPTHSTISTLMAGNLRVEQVVDPQAGDELMVVLGVPGRFVPSERNYIEFSTLVSAAGLVVMPYVDDLSVGINGNRVTITRPGGLSLTPPAMPTATMADALGNGTTPSFLDFAHWRAITGGSFLATERRLRAATVRLDRDHANRGRLQLARFFLANRFAAEALGVINQMQAVDPGLAGDLQLQTMKAAASLQMGRYRDAHNALAGAQFDADRHAALWRGLTNAAMENWEEARVNLERAAPVLRAYDPEIQAQVHLATIEVALATQRLEVADAEMDRVPNDLGGTLAVQAMLDRARLFAAEHQNDRAEVLFDKVERSGNEALAAQAIYYRIGARLANNSVTPQAAINALERLRFRWRGDGLEIKTLRKLASIYFAHKRWREGLNTLRVLTTNFASEDVGVQAMDDMRGAFVNLFLKGEADKMEPVAALGLFYDFIELTPIGADGDEMIRHMADRLVRVDLLGPAADLLNYQVTRRLDGVARAQVATRLAMVQLLDHNPAAVLDTLRSTQISTLPDDVSHQRLLMEARALAEQKHYDHALDLLAVDQQADTQQLRAEIYWQSSNWAMAAQAAEQSLGERYSDERPLGDLEREVVMRAAVAYSLANDQTSLDRLRTNFLPKMRGTPNAAAFAVVTERIDLQGVAFRDAAAKVASVDTLRLFMTEMQRRQR